MRLGGAKVTTTLQCIFELFKVTGHNQLRTPSPPNMIMYGRMKFITNVPSSTSLIAGSIGRKEGRQACHFLAAHPQKSKAVPDQKSWKTQTVPYHHHKWDTDTIRETDLLKAQDMGLKYTKHRVMLCRWKLSNDLVRKTIRSRTACTGSPRRFACIGRPMA